MRPASPVLIGRPQTWCMVQSVELVLDDVTDAAVRAQWEVLKAAGLPSQAHHTQPSNRPHITLVAQDAIEDEGERAMAALASPLPLAVRLGTYQVFGRHRFVLVRPVIADVALLDFQRDLQAAAGPPSPHMEPGRWVPHVTLCHRMSAEQVGLALTLLTGAQDGAETTEGQAVAARRWDGPAKREWVLME